MSGGPLAFKLDASADGLTLARRWIETRQPGGFVSTLAIHPVEVSKGRMRVVCDAGVSHSNFTGLIHGGTISALVDVAGGGAAMTLLQPGETLLTTDLLVRFLDAANADAGPIHAEGRVSRRVNSKIVADVEISGDDGGVIAHGSVGVSVRRPR